MEEGAPSLFQTIFVLALSFGDALYHEIHCVVVTTSGRAPQTVTNINEPPFLGLTQTTDTFAHAYVANRPNSSSINAILL